MNKIKVIFLLFSMLINSKLSSEASSEYKIDSLTLQVLKAMELATRYFRKEVATNGGYLFYYKSDFTMRQGEEIASPSTIWVQPPGTPAVGMVFLQAYNATGDTLFLNGAISAARALVWGQLASGGWDYRIDFDPVESEKWYYRRNAESGDSLISRKRNRSTLDDNNTQSALHLIMQVDETLDFKDSEIHHAAMYCLDALVKVQYPNGAWPQQFSSPPDPAKFPVKKAHYPVSWSREYSGISYSSYYTFNDNTMSDVIKTMIEAYRIYSDEQYIMAAKRCGDFMILAQMPDPQPAWAQQYNADMEPAWARKFEPPAISGGETFSVLQSLLDLYVDTGEPRFLEPVPAALKWAENSLLPDKRMARFYELMTNRPLYFNAPRQYSNLPAPAFPALKDYTLIYEDSDLPNHYSFKVTGASIKRIRSYYNHILKEGREVIIMERKAAHEVNMDQIIEIISSLDEKGRWIEKGRLKTNDPGSPYIETDIISSSKFIRNLSLLTTYIKSQKK